MNNEKNYIKFLRQYVGHEPILTAGVSGDFLVEQWNWVKVLKKLQKEN